MDADTLAERRKVEDRAVELGRERVEMSGRLVENQAAIVHLLDDAARVGVPVDHVARLVGVRRQSLYKWQALARASEGTRR